MLELPLGYFMTKDVEKFWDDITVGSSHDPDHMMSNVIHNLALRYFQMILAYTFLERSDVDHHVGDEEVFFLFCANQSCPVSYGNFLMWNLHTIALPSESVIHVGGMVMHIVIALGLKR